MQKRCPVMDTLMACSRTKSMFKRHMQHVQKTSAFPVDLAKVLCATSLRDFDASCAAPCLGYASVDDYYLSQSSIEQIEVWRRQM